LTAFFNIYHQNHEAISPFLVYTKAKRHECARKVADFF